MILVDDRIGSADLVGHLRHWHVPCEMSRLEFGDAAFAGNGPDGPVTVGIEIKKVHDAINCMEDGRFAGHQLPGLVQRFDWIWMVVEGAYRPDFQSGLLLMGGERRREVAHGARRFMYRDLDNWLTTLEVRANIRIRRSGDRPETARFIADLYGWWNKEWEDHTSHLALHNPVSMPDAALLVKPNLVRMVAAQLPGIGWKKSMAVAKHFKSVRGMLEAGIEAWQKIDGIGKVLGERIFYALRGRE